MTWFGAYDSERKQSVKANYLYIHDTEGEQPSPSLT